MTVPAAVTATVAGVALAAPPPTSAAPAPAGAPSASPPYAPTGWVTLHGDPGNRKQQLGVRPAQKYRGWGTLRDAAVLTAPTLGPGGRLYFTTGRAKGAANLHAFRVDGTPLWTSAPWRGKTGVDSCAVASSPIVDESGNVYVSDCDQVWSYGPDGRVRWVKDLPAAPAGSPFQVRRTLNPFVTAVFTRDGALLGVTTFGQVVVLDRATGRQLAPVTELPGGLAPPASRVMPPNVWSGGFLDREIRPHAWQVLFGGIVESANTPAVDRATGRVFVAATGRRFGTGALYGLDVTATGGARRVRVAFEAPMGPGSGSSPTLSPDARTVYTCDGEGNLYAFATRTGQRRWLVAANCGAASVTMGPDGTIYPHPESGAGAAFAPNGRKRWNVDVSALTRRFLPDNRWLGKPVGDAGGTITAVKGALLLPVNFGYRVRIGTREVTVPVRTSVVEIDPATGRARREVLRTAGPSEGIAAVAPDGTVMVSQGAMATTVFAAVAPAVNALLTGGHKVIPPTGGLEVFRPTS